MTRFGAWVAGLVLLVMMTSARAEPVVVFAAASLKGALDEAAQSYPHEVTVSYGGSGAIARQVALGAPADVVILAHADWMDWLQDQGIIEQGSRRSLWGNRLVLIGAPGVSLKALSGPALRDALGGGRLAVGQVASVPAGIYAREWLEKAGLWSAVEDRLAETENVRAALMLVARGEAPLGIVYASDARAANVTVLHRVDPDLHGPITYPAALVHSRENPEAADFLTYLENDPQGIFAARGFDRVAAP